eukprot:gene3899-4866_t
MENNNDQGIAMDQVESKSMDNSATPTTTSETPTESASPSVEVKIIDYSEYKQQKEDPEKIMDGEGKKQEEKKSIYSRTHPYFYLREHLNETKLVLASMSYKFAFETLSSALGLLVLTRFDSFGVTLLAIMNIIYFVSQSVGSVLVGPFVRSCRPSRVASLVLATMAAVITFIIILEASTGGTIDDLGTWEKWIIIVVYLLMGGCLGMLEISRKLTPRQILGNDNVKLGFLNGTVHIFYEVAGTSGAFFSTFLIKQLGPVYALSHQPFFFLISCLLFWSISQPFPPQKEVVPKTHKREQKTWKRIPKKVGTEIVGYFNTIFTGGKIILSPSYWWIIPTYVLPQVLHRLLENLLFPSFSKLVLKDGSLSGILTGGSNFGELLGALAIVKFGKKVKNPLWWVRLDALFTTLVWTLVYPPTLDKPIYVAASLLPIMVVVSSSWAAGDISLLSFLQSKFPLNVKSSDLVADNNENTDSEKSEVESDAGSETTPNGESKLEDSTITIDDISDSEIKYSNAQAVDDEDDPPPGSPLASVLSFLFATYAIVISLLSFGLGITIDHFQEQGNLRMGYFAVGGVGFTVCGGIILITSFLTKNNGFKEIPKIFSCCK